jgi:hypothetical protein
VSYYQENANGLRLSVRVQPRASRSKLDGVVEDQLRVRLTAPPVENAANQACAAFLAEVLGVARSKVQLVGGQKSRDKVFQVDGDPGELLRKLSEALDRS